MNQREIPQTKGEALKLYLKSMEEYQKKLLINFQDNQARLRDEYRQGNITEDEIKKLKMDYGKAIDESQRAYKEFIDRLKDPNQLEIPFIETTIPKKYYEDYNSCNLATNNTN